MSEPKDRCRAIIWKRDTYRRTGRGKNGFELHFNEKQCARAAKSGGLCTQHKRMADQGWNLSFKPGA